MLQPKHLAGMMLCTVCLFPGTLVNAQAHRELAVPVVSSVLEDLDGSVLGARPMQIESSPRGGLIATDWGDFFCSGDITCRGTCYGGRVGVGKAQANSCCSWTWRSISRATYEF